LGAGPVARGHATSARGERPHRRRVPRAPACTSPEGGQRTLRTPTSTGLAHGCPELRRARLRPRGLPLATRTGSQACVPVAQTFRAGSDSPAHDSDGVHAPPCCSGAATPLSADQVPRSVWTPFELALIGCAGYGRFGNAVPETWVCR